jgi:lysophospholipase L1-like esterase
LPVIGGAASFAFLVERGLFDAPVGEQALAMHRRLIKRLSAVFALCSTGVATIWAQNSTVPVADAVIALPARSFDRRFHLPGDAPKPAEVRFDELSATATLRWSVDEAGVTVVELPEALRDKPSGSLTVEALGPGGQAENGRITFSTGTATLQGDGLRAVGDADPHLEGWGDGRTATWAYKPTRWGTYDVEVVVSVAEACSVAVDVSGRSFSAKASPGGEGRWYATIVAGRLHLENETPLSVKVAVDGPGASRCLLKAVVLRPAPEGEVPQPGPDGVVTLAASTATTHSVTMRYEPAAIKNCLGYWVRPSDWADWKFETSRAGAYDVEVLQGCGNGQGGSDVAVDVEGRRFEFVVQETGHFQIFVPRRIGRVYLDGRGGHTLAVRPLRKQAGAVMDVRQVRLVPAEDEVPAAAKLFAKARRILVVGDSITYSGEWVDYFETWLRLASPGSTAEVINLGLPSETVSGLSEPGHAGGSFPRPDLHERLGRALSSLHPDVVVACYGMNDGIYFPLSSERFAAFKAGMERLHKAVEAEGAVIIHMTPPVFDAGAIADRVLPAGRSDYPSPFAGYDEVLARYGEWLLERRADGWIVADVHGPMRRALDQRRAKDPKFAFAGDGVHPGAEGHWLMARALLALAGAPFDLAGAETADVLFASHPQARHVFEMVRQRQRVMKDAWLTAIGHKRPGMAAGRAVAEALGETAPLARGIFEAADLSIPGRCSVWHGFVRHDFEVDGKPVAVVSPRVEAPGRPWLWQAEFFGHKPEPDIALLGRGFHVVYMALPDMLGGPEAVAHWNILYKELTSRYGFGPKPGLAGLSRGGLYIYNWAEANPDKVGALYADAPVCDLKSWPGGKGKGPGSARDWEFAKQVYGFKTDEEALAFKGNPVDNLAPLAAAHVPLLHVYGDADELVPWEENTGVVAERYRALGGGIELISKPGGRHHPHGLEDSTPITEFLWENCANPAAKAWLAAHGGGPLDAGLKPLLRKLGTEDLDLVETTPVVHEGRLWRFEWVRAGYWNNGRKTNYFRFIDPATGETTAPFADGCEFGSAFVRDGVVYVTGDEGRSRIRMFTSRDLKTWETSVVFEDPAFSIFNTSLCDAGSEGFVLMFEIDKPADQAGVPFTARFLKSRDLKAWTLTPSECNYAKDRYTAPHCLRWLDGWFYDFYLEARDGYEMRVVRSRDLVHWIPSPLNPVLKASPEDKIIANGRLNDEQRARVAHAVNLNNSDIDFCEWRGRLDVTYSWGNQQGVEHLAKAVYDGGLKTFLQGWFPAGR